MTPKKIILFGAGEIGLKALKHFGDENVECFVDNNKNKVGQTYYGKPVIGVEELAKIVANTEIVISNSFVDEISQQLKALGITNYSSFAASTSVALKRIISHGEAKGGSGNIALHCVGMDSAGLIHSILESRLGDKVKYITAESNSDQIGKNVEGYTVCDLSQTTSDIDTLIMVTEKNHAAIGALLRKKYGQLFKIIDPFRRTLFFDTDTVVYNRYTSDIEYTEEEWIDVNENISARRLTDEFVETVADDVPLFEFIEIETINRCNGVCGFCPVNRHDDLRPEHLMDIDLFKNIVDQLTELNFSGYFALFSNNEPLLDARIIELAQYAKVRLQKAHVYMYSNGTLFTLNKFIRIIEHLDELVIDNYTKNLELIKPCEEIVSYIEQNPELGKKVTISIRKPDEIITSRGGQSPNRIKIRTYGDEKCALPFRQMVVRPDGKISLCCNDTYGKYALGDLTQQSLLECWYGQEYMNVREAIYKGRKHLDLCEKCDTFLML